MRILVTGGAGFIGSHLTDALLAAGHDVVVLDNFSTGKQENLPRSPRLTLLEGDVADGGAVAAAVAGCSAVFHLAAVASVQASVNDPVGTNRTNLAGTITVLDAAARAGAEQVAYACSAAVYGDTQELPISEQAATRPLTPYAIDKLAGEQYLAYWHAQGAFRGTSFRFFNIFGPRQDPASPYSGVISIFAQRVAGGQPLTVYGDGTQTRDFVFVKDLVRILVASLDFPAPQAAPLPVINVGAGRGVSLLELAATLGQLAGSEPALEFAPVRSGDIRHSLADNGRLRQLQPALRFTDFGAALQQTLADGAAQPLSGRAED
jgi:UDP-glucose 4-epimerase